MAGDEAPSRQTVETRVVNGPEPDAQLVLRGFFAVNDKAYASLHDKRTGGKTWLAVGESAYGYDLTEISIREQRALITDGQHVFSLSLDNQEGARMAAENAERVRVAEYKRSFEELSESEKKYYRENPRAVLGLRSSGYAVPRDVLRDAMRARRAGVSNKPMDKGNTEVGHAESVSNREADDLLAAMSGEGDAGVVRKRYPVPMTNVGFTKAERAAAAKAASGIGGM